MAGRKPNRTWTPALPARDMQTFAVDAPESTHFRPATCEEVECQAYRNGWRTKVDLTTEMGQKQAHYIKHDSGRSYKVVEQRDGLVTLEFRGGQPCFGQHRIRLERPEIFSVRPGDHRVDLRSKRRVHSKPEHWIEEFQENQERIIAVRENRWE